MNVKYIAATTIIGASLSTLAQQPQTSTELIAQYQVLSAQRETDAAHILATQAAADFNDFLQKSKQLEELGNKIRTVQAAEAQKTQKTPSEKK